MRADDTMDEVKQFIKDYNHDRTTVNMERFTRETPDEILEELSNYWIKAFNWKGTKYEKEWNK
jgi:arsenate reductase-like glutaredoxin family protein